MPCVPQVSDAHAPGHPRDVKENVIHQTRPRSSIAPWSSSDAHVPTVAAFGSGQGSAWAPWLVWGMQPHMQQSVMHCVFWHLSIRTSINFLSNLSYSSSVGSDHMGQPSLPTCINEPWLPMTLSPVHRSTLLGPLLIDTDHCRPRTLHKKMEMLWPSHLAITNWLATHIFPASNTSTLSTKCCLIQVHLNKLECRGKVNLFQ